MSVSVIISNLNGARFLPRLLQSLRDQRGVELEVIVVDRESRDESARILAEHPAVRVLSEPAQTGLVTGYHRGMQAAAHDRLFFSNEDMWFDPDCLARLEAWIRPAEGIVAADPWQWSYDGTEWIHGGTRFRPAAWSMNGLHPRRDFDFLCPLATGDLVPFPCAGAFMMDRASYETLGGWDTTMFLDYEDVDLFLRAWQRGWKCVAVPEARVYHAVGSSNQQQPGSQPVSERRYRSNRASRTLVPLKYFSARARWLGWANLAANLANNLVNLRLSSVRRDLDVLRNIRAARPAAEALRARNAEWNDRRPGEGFFFDPAFQASKG